MREIEQRERERERERLKQRPWREKAKIIYRGRGGCCKYIHFISQTKKYKQECYVQTECEITHWPTTLLATTIAYQ